MKIFKLKETSIPSAIIYGSIIIGFSFFLTIWVFFGGENNKQKLSVKNPKNERINSTNALSPEQIKMLQEQRAAQLNKLSPTKVSTSTTE